MLESAGDWECPLRNTDSPRANSVLEEAHLCTGGAHGDKTLTSKELLEPEGEQNMRTMFLSA